MDRSIIADEGGLAPKKDKDNLIEMNPSQSSSTVQAPAPEAPVIPRASVEMAQRFEEMKQRTSISIERKSLQLNNRPNVVDLPKPDKGKNKPVASDYNADEHTLDLQALAERYNTRINFNEPKKSQGLTSEEAASRLARDGKNLLTPPKQTPEIIKYLKYYINIFMLLLEGAAVLCLIAFGLDPTQLINLWVAIVLIVIVVANCTMNYIQERRSSSVMAGFANLLPLQCKVVRDGHETKILAEELVCGDFIIIQGGDKVPADVRLISCEGLKVDNSSLTGEAEPQPRNIVTKEENPLEAHNIAFSGTLALDGGARGIVFRTGDNTLIGNIAGLAGRTDKQDEETTLQREVRRFVYFVLILSVSMGVIFFVLSIALATNRNTAVIIGALVNTIGVIVANVPEGLPATVTACLMLVGKTMAAKNVWIKKLESIETLGSTTLIASDKTGTLTQNRMTAVHVWYDTRIHATKEADIVPKMDLSTPSCAALMRIAALCSKSEFDHQDVVNNVPIEKRKIYGDASEQALLRLSESNFSVQKMRDENPKIFEVPFNSTNKYQLSIHNIHSENQRMLLMKGAPEIIFTKCSSYIVDGKVHPMTPEFEAAFNDACTRLASMGERVLGFAQISMNDGINTSVPYNVEAKNFPVTELTFVGLIALIDPPRDGVPAAVKKCQEAGIQVVMVTGDHPLTARSIAKQIGIISSPTVDEIAAQRGIPVNQVPEEDIKAVVVTGMQVKTLTDEDWDRIIRKKEIVFARTSPQQKLQIVEHFQSIGHCVAVTGDGVNDSPALKQADIGVAMGITGSDVAKDAAGVVLMDDNFCSIVNAIEQGRIIFDNLKKSVTYELSHLLPEVVPFMLNALLGLPLGLSAVLILAIDLGTELAPAISLAYEKPEADIMKRKPRDRKKEHLVSFPSLLYSYLEAGLIESVACFICYWYILQAYGLSLSDVFLRYGYFAFGAPTLVLSSGREISSDQQLQIVRYCQAAWFLCIVFCQVANIIVCKTRSVSVFVHGFKNKTLIIAVFIELVILVILTFVPGISDVFAVNPIPATVWALPLPWMFFLFVASEIRKAWTRKYKKGWVAYFLAW